jgi:hypothetical protein
MTPFEIDFDRALAESWWRSMCLRHCGRDYGRYNQYMFYRIVYGLRAKDAWAMCASEFLVHCGSVPDHRPYHLHQVR